MRLKCFFCENQQEPDYKEFDMLRKFISDRGKLWAGIKVVFVPGTSVAYLGQLNTPGIWHCCRL